MDKLKQLLEAYAGLCDLVFKVIPGTNSLSPSTGLLLMVLFTWVVVPLFFISVLVALWWTVKWVFITGVIVLLLFPSFYIWSQSKNKDK